jgi:hypothetical protein
VHAQFEADLEFARRMAADGSGFGLGAAGQLPRDYAAAPGDLM